MEAIIVIVGFLGAGKTTLLKRLIREYMEDGWSPYMILNDYENANLDADQFLDFLEPEKVKALHGSCICCSGVFDLRNQINSIPERSSAVTFVEANGTSDAVTLMEFIGVGLKDRFLPPVQISVVDVKNWQKRSFYNDLEANQVQVASMIILNHTDDVTEQRIQEVRDSILELNPQAFIQTWNEFESKKLLRLKASQNKAQKFEHLKAHWSSCSVDLPDPISALDLKEIVDSLPKGILRVKGCTRLDDDKKYTYIEKTPTDKDIRARPHSGYLATGPKLLVIGPGSDPEKIQEIIQKVLNK